MGFRNEIQEAICEQLGVCSQAVLDSFLISPHHTSSSWVLRLQPTFGPSSDSVDVVGDGIP